MIWGALGGLAVYLTVDVLRARQRYLRHEREWSEERKALASLQRLNGPHVPAA